LHVAAAAAADELDDDDDGGGDRHNANDDQLTMLLISTPVLFLSCNDLLPHRTLLIKILSRHEIFRRCSGKRS